ncbi:hypothetical protein [Persephonella sp.]
MRALLSLVLGAVILFSCGGKPDRKETIVLSSGFSMSDVSWFYKKGDNILIGQAFLRTENGTVITCAGYEVQLIPYSEYAAERLRFIYGNDKEGFIPIEKYPKKIKFYPDYAEFDRVKKTAVCDANGIFKFKDLPDGTYFVITKIIWYAPRLKGGYLMKRVTLEKGEVRELLLSRQVMEEE